MNSDARIEARRLTAVSHQPGEMVSPGGYRTRLSVRCPDSRPCSLPVFCSQLCSRLESAEITAEMQADAATDALGRTGAKK